MGTLAEEYVETDVGKVQLFRGGDGPPLVYLHSAAGEAVNPTAEALADSFSVVAPVFPGFGESEGIDKIDDMEDATFHHLDLFDRLGLASLPVMGLSFGGWMAAELATRYPERVSKMVLVNPVGPAHVAHAIDRRAVFWGVVVGAIQGATPLGFWWLPNQTVYAMGIAVIGAIYIGFAVADGRPNVIAVETTVAFTFVLIAAAAITGTAWLLVVGLAGHGLKDMWQHRTQFVSTTRWWPPFCLVVDWTAAAIIAGEILAGVHFHH